MPAAARANRGEVAVLPRINRDRFKQVNEMAAEQNGADGSILSKPFKAPTRKQLCLQALPVKSPGRHHFDKISLRSG